MATMRMFPMGTLMAVLREAESGNEAHIASTADYVRSRNRLRNLILRLKAQEQDVYANDLQAIDRLTEKVQVAMINLDKAIKKVINHEHL